MSLLPRNLLPEGSEVYCRFDPSDGYEGLLFSASRRSQAAEMNDMQDTLLHRIDSLGNVLFKDGSVVDGGVATVVSNDAGTVNIKIAKGRVYVGGMVYPFEDTFLTTPVVGKVRLGVRIHTTIVDHTVDERLLSPAVGRRGHMEPGASRVKRTMRWGWVSENSNDLVGQPEGTSVGEGDFYPVYDLVDNVLIFEDQPPMSKLIYSIVGRYDHDANGDYISDGLRLRFVAETEDAYSFQLDAGSAHIDGKIITLGSDMRLSYPKDPDSFTAQNEPRTFRPDASGKFQFIVARPPIKEVGEVVGIRELTATLQRGVTSGGKDIINADPIIGGSILEIVEVTQGGTPFAANTYSLDGDEISWSPGGAEPAPGSTYSVRYRFNDATIVPESVSADRFVVSGLVTNSIVQADYVYNLPRIDLLVLRPGGQIVRITGQAQLRNPPTPRAGQNEIALATIEYDWINRPIIRNIGTRAVHMSQNEEMGAEILNLKKQVAALNLLVNATSKDPAAKLGTFVDPFFDDDLRDEGVEQTAAIGSGFLMLAIDAVPQTPPDNNAAASTLDFTNVVEFAQTAHTNDSLINPYQAYDHVAHLTLSPNSDTWTLFVSQYLSQLTMLLVRSSLVLRLGAVEARRQRREAQLLNSSGGAENSSDDNTRDSLTSTPTVGITVRQRELEFTIRDFGNGEAIAEAYFDGVPIAGVVGTTASAQGVITDTFTIPANIPTGLKRVWFIGSGGSIAETTYATQFNVVPDPPPRRDPLGQTFTRPSDFMLSAVDVQFTRRGSVNAKHPVFVQLRPTSNGLPAPQVLGESRVNYDDIFIPQDRRTISIPLRGVEIYKGNPNLNYLPWGYNRVCRHSGNNEMRMLYDLQSSIPLLDGATIYSAKLKLVKWTWSGASNWPIIVSRMTQEWVQNQATWNRAKTGTLWDTPGGDFATAGSDPTATFAYGHNTSAELNIKDIVQAWADGQPNHGLMVRAAAVDESSDWLYMQPWYQSMRPVIEVDYVPAAVGGAAPLEGLWTRATFNPPVLVRGGQEHAICLVTRDSAHAVGIARLRNYRPLHLNPGNEGWQERQAYLEGVLADSSNDSAWSPRQDDDLTFRLIRAQFTPGTKTVLMGSVPGTNVTDLLPRANTLIPSGDTKVSFEIIDPASIARTTENNETLALPDPVTGNFQIRAKLTGTERLSPILYPNTTVLMGSIKTTGDYVSRDITANTSNSTSTLNVILESYLPGSAGVVIYAAQQRLAGGNPVIVDGVYQYDWVEVPLVANSDRATGDGFVERTYAISNLRLVGLDRTTKIKVAMTGGASARLLARNLQAFIK